MRFMADSINLDDIPAGRYPLIAYYVDGGFEASAAQLARHEQAGSRMVSISVGANPQNAIVGDVENGDYTPAEAPDFVLRQRDLGIDPTIYCSLNAWPAVRAAFAARGVAEPHYWIAAYPGNGAQLYAGSIAHQYANDLTSGGHFDLSVVADFWPGVDNAAGGGIGGTDMTQAEFDALVLANPILGNLGAALEQGFTIQRVLNKLDRADPQGEAGKSIAEMIAAVPAGGAAEPPEPTEPPEPKTVTLQIPAQTITGTLA